MDRVISTSFARVTALLATLALVACSGSEFGGLDGSKKATGDKKAQSEGAQNDGLADEENQKSDKPVEVAGAFLTADCGWTTETVAGLGADREAIGCAVIDSKAKTKYKGDAKLSTLTFTFDDGTTETAKLSPVTSGSSPWHAMTSLPKDRLGKAAQIAASITAGGKTQDSVNQTPGGYDPENQAAAHAPKDLEPSYEVTAQVLTVDWLGVGVQIPDGWSDIQRESAGANVTQTGSPASKLIDDRIFADANGTAGWAAGRDLSGGPLWVWVKFAGKTPFRAVDLVVDQMPPCQTEHQLIVGRSDPSDGIFPKPDEIQLPPVKKDTAREQVLRIEIDPPVADATYVRVLSKSSCSFIAWLEIWPYR